MILRPCLSVKPFWTPSTLESFAALRSLPSASFTSALTSPTLRHSAVSTCSNPVLPNTVSYSHRPMPWAGQVACNSNLLHLNGARKGLAASQRLASNLAPYFGGLAVLSAGSFYLQRQKARQSRQRCVLNQGAAVVETSALADMTITTTASLSSSEFDTDAQPPVGDDNPAAARDK